MIWILLSIVLIGLLLDLYLPIKKDFRRFDPVVTGQLDEMMWRSYYEKKPVKLFFQLTKLMRSQFGAPLVRSFVMAYRSAKAAFIFKNGTNRAQYEKAFPDLKKYFTHINALSKEHFDVDQMTHDELEWWIIRRERDQHPPSDWSTILQKELANMYHMPMETFKPHADLRVEAMVYRDNKGDQITQSDWDKIQNMCIDAWTLLYKAVN